MSERKIYSLTQLNRSIENHFFEFFSQKDFWITAELIRINTKNGHSYLELADSVNDRTSAQSSAVIWSMTYDRIVSEVGIKEIQGILQPGNKILMNVKIEYHTIYGLKLRINAIDPSYSYGEIERKRQEVIKRLKKEGLFFNQKNVKLPTIIKRIALIGSPGTSGYRDFLNELFNNYDFTNFKLKEFAVSVQGQQAVPGIVAAIKEANLYDADVIIILRGGGSKMDLSLFDDYEINKAICESRLPVLTGIGHETDEVVADLVARQHFITPTAVGQFIQYEINSFKEIMRELHDKAMNMSIQLIGEHKEEFNHYNNYLTHFSRELVQFWKQRFREISYTISEKSRIFLFEEKDDLASLSHNLASQLKHLVNKEESSLDSILDRVEYLSVRKIDRERNLSISQALSTIQLMSQQVIDKERIGLNNQNELLTLLNPHNILASGFTISTINDIDIKNVEVEIGDEMKTLSSNYLLVSKIISKENIKNEDN